MNFNLLKKYIPYVYYDENEPFYPVHIGCTIFDQTGPSPSFKRDIKVDGHVNQVIEYAYYYHYDSQHLFDLEHVWVYLDQSGNIVDCEGSFHGKYLKCLLHDQSNIDDETHIRLYAQPGKHAFMPKAEYFYLLPDLYSVNNEGIGKDGLLVTSIAKGRYSTDDEIDALVKKYMEDYRFVPSMHFEMIENFDKLLTRWEELDNNIPRYIELELIRIKE